MSTAEWVSSTAEWARHLARLASLEVLYSTLLFGVVCMLSWALRGRSPHLLYGLWGLVLLRLVLPPALALPFSARSIGEEALRAGWGWFAGATSAMGTDASFTGARLSTSVEKVPPASAGWLLLVMGWAGGMAGVAITLARRRRACGRLLARARPVEDVQVLALLEQWRARLGVRRKVRLLTSEAPLSPLTVGSLRPIIFLPAAVLQHPAPAVVESVLAHELAHVRRWDDLRLMLLHALRSVYFFHPVAWIGASRLGAECERICDGMVLSFGTLSPRAYGRSLLEILKLPLEGPAEALAFHHPQKRYRMRIRHILELDGARRPVRPFLSLASVALAGVLLLPMASRGSHQEPAPAASQAGPIRALRNPLPGSRVTAPYGKQVDPWTKAPAKHRGIDVAAKAGSLILAPAPGRVEVATTRYEGGGSYGTVVVVDHGGGLKTFYAHLGELAVEVGQQVEAGAVLGTQGATGKVTGPHLHFEVWARGAPVDPAAYVAEWRTATAAPR